MSVWLPPAALSARRAAAGGPLAPLADSLADDLATLFERDLSLPREKARLSRTGGRCATDGTLLAFDPWSPRLHRCPACGAEYADDAHYRWWIMNRQLWLAERGVHAALLYVLRGDPRHREIACTIVRNATGAYLEYPNRDNVLGPTRPFFSTYLESIWLLQLCVAIDLLETAEQGIDAQLAHAARERLVAPSAELIASYDEGFSNRQVWNNAALLAAATLLGDEALATRAVWGDERGRAHAGLVHHLQGALLPDGSWYEGENYHLFAHRGLWYGVRLAEAAGQGPLPAALVSRFREGFATPFLTALPDFVMPARRDSQYGVSLRQWRFAELAELGLAERPDDHRLHHALAVLYDGSAAEHATGRWRSTAEAERNEPPSRLSRADLGWRSLLAALPELPPLQPRAPRSVLLEAQGLAVFRRGPVYVALDYGVSGGGHGHPDRLGLLLSIGTDRWLDDPGTGSYVDPSLHWYRSTLAHNAPLVDDRSQRPASGVLLAHEERDGAGWADAAVTDAAPGVELRRTVVVMPGYLLDVLTWSADRDVIVGLPLHHDAELHGAHGWAPADPSPLEGGRYLCDAERAGEAEAMISLRHSDRAQPVAFVTSPLPIDWWRASAPGAAGLPRRRMYLARVRGREGSICGVWSWSGDVTALEPDGATIVVQLATGDEHRHARSKRGWHVDLLAPHSRSSIDLGGLRPKPPAPPTRHHGVTPSESAHLLDAPLRIHLGAHNYRRSEQSWHEAGRPTADVELAVRHGALRIDVRVAKPELAFAPVGGENEMDNERPEINGDGVQLHVIAPALGGAAGAPMLGWIFVPGEGPGVHVVALDGRSAELAPRAEWQRTSSGYALGISLSVGALRGTSAPADEPVLAAIGVVVNDGAPARERRRGQLVFGRADEEFVYLRGDRHDPARCIPLLLPHG